jgi:hypothetical protein
MKGPDVREPEDRTGKIGKNKGQKNTCDSYEDDFPGFSKYSYHGSAFG